MYGSTKKPVVVVVVVVVVDVGAEVLVGNKESPLVRAEES